MNLFVVASSGEPPVRALAALLARLPFFPGREVRSWTSPARRWSAAWVTHAPAQTCGATYARARRDLLALYSGRPFLWTADAAADGRAPIDPGFWLERTEFGDLDGRFVGVRVDDEGAQVVTDALGAYPVYTTRLTDVEYVSNSAELLRSISGSRLLDTRAVAELLGGGWSLGGHPMWSAVRRSNPPSGSLPAPAGHGFDAERAAARLVAAVRALADWPGRPNVVAVTGGRDSRLVLAAALAAGIEFETRTGGEPGHPDVEIGRALAEAAGVPWRLLEHDPHGSVAGDWRRAAELLDLTCSGTASLSDAAGFPFGPRPGPLWLWHSGQGGELARSYYGSGGGLGRDALVGRLYRAFCGRRPGRSEILGEPGRQLVRESIAAFVDEQLDAGAAPADVPDLFYLWRRMGTWAGPTHGAVEYVRDTTSPLWSARLLEDELGLAAHERAREVFHLRVLELLAPQLVDVPFEDGREWPARQSALALRAQRAATLARKVRGELQRRTGSARRAADAGGGPDPFDATLGEIRELVLDQPSHPAWEVLDRARVEQLLGARAAALDTMSRYYAWRLATVFSAPLS